MKTDEEFIEEYQHRLARCFRLAHGRYPTERELHELTELADACAYLTGVVPLPNRIVWLRVLL